MSGLNGHTPRFNFPGAVPATTAEAAAEDTPCVEARTDTSCVADLTTRVTGILRDPRYAERFEHLPADEQAALRQHTDRMYRDAQRLWLQIRAALNVPATEHR